MPHSSSIDARRATRWAALAVALACLAAPSCLAALACLLPLERALAEVESSRSLGVWGSEPRVEWLDYDGSLDAQPVDG